MGEKEVIPDRSTTTDQSTQTPEAPTTAADLSRQAMDTLRDAASPMRSQDEQKRQEDNNLRSSGATVKDRNGQPIAMRFDSPSINELCSSGKNGNGGSPEKPEGSDGKKEKGVEGKDKPLAKDTQEAKDKFLEQMKDRLDPADFQKLQQELNKMDQRILNNKVLDKDKNPIDQQKELKKTYDSLNKLADGTAEDKEKGLKYTNPKTGKQENVYDKDDVNKIVCDTVSKLADPEHQFNQGKHNTCALQAAGRQEAAMSPSTYAERQAQLARTGEFTATGKDGQTQTVKVDRGSLRLDDEARNNGLWATGDVRKAAGHNNDLAMAQLNLNQKYGTNEKGEGNRIYTQNPNTRAQGDTGERVVDTRSGKVVGNSPEIDARGISNVKQAAFGDRFGANFGKDTTFVNAAAFGNIDNVSCFTNGQQMKDQLKANEAKGWQYSTIGMHTGHWSGSEGQGGAGGWHAVSVSMAQGDKVNVINNWGGKFNFTDANGKAQDADKVLGWMNDTTNTPGSGYKPGDHQFDPDGKTRPDKDKPDPEKKEPKDEKKEPQEREQSKKDVDPVDAFKALLAAQHADAVSKMENLKTQISSLSANDSRRQSLQAELSSAQSTADWTRIASSIYS
jgi:hypothetical protein